MSDTPKTDAAEASALEVGQWHLAKLCRELERENATLREDKARLDWLDENTGDIHWYGKDKYICLANQDVRVRIDAARKEAQP